MTVKSVAVGRHFEEFIESSIKTGRFSNVSEVIREGLRLLEEREVSIESLRRELLLGENSEIDEDFSFESLNAELDKRLDNEKNSTKT